MRRILTVFSIPVFALFGLTGCPEHDTLYHCGQALSALKEWQQQTHGNDFIYYANRQGNYDYCTIYSGDYAHWHYAVIDIYTEQGTWTHG